MASTFTTNLRLEKPGYNEQSDTWGATESADKDRFDACLGGAIYGLTLSTAGSSGTFGIAAGGASGMSLASAYTKTTSAWAVGSGNGALDTGAIANSTWYHVWLIERVDVSPAVTDVLISLSATAPTMPANYTRKRLIGSMKTDGAAHWTLFHQLGDDFLWDVPVADASTSPADGNAALVTLSVPTGIKTEAFFAGQMDYGASLDLMLITSPEQADTAPGSSTLYDLVVKSAAQTDMAQFRRRTNTSSQIRVRMQVSGGGSPSGAYKIFTYGFRHPRGQY